MFKYSSVLNTKALLPLWLGIIVVILFDMIIRLTNLPTYETATWQSNNIAVGKKRYLSGNQAKAIISGINNFEKNALAVNNKDQNTLQTNELNQQGDLNQLYAGNFRYRVIGIFKEKAFFAVIQQHNLKTKERKLIQVGISESINNYQVIKIMANKVLLTSTDNRQVNLFLYKNNTKKTKNTINSK